MGNEISENLLRILAEGMNKILESINRIESGQLITNEWLAKIASLREEMLLPLVVKDNLPQPVFNNTQEEIITKTLDTPIIYQARAYSKFRTCKYKCGNWVSFDHYKNPDAHPIHFDNGFKPLGDNCPKYS